MSAPEERLLGDAAADRFQLLATAVFSCGQEPAPILEELSAAVIALCLDRAARMEMDVVRRAGKTQNVDERES